MYHIFLGADPREKEALQVARHSIERFNNADIKVHSLETQPLRNLGLYDRSFRVTAEGQMIDDADGRPFSTAFTFTRFLVPELWRQETGKKSSLVMFADCDFVFIENPQRLFAEVEAAKLRYNGKFPVYVVQHNYKPLNETKMDGTSQSAYNRKLWAALIIFDMDHPDNAQLTPEMVNSEDGRNLMNFCWINDQLSIGNIHERWHWVPNHTEKNISQSPPAAIHFTEGGPWFPNYRQCRYADVWLTMYNDYLQSSFSHVTFNTDKLLF